MSISLKKSLIKNQYIMKKLYHLFVTSYKLRVKLPRFCFAKSPLQNLKGIYYPHIISSSHHVGSLRATPLLILILLLPFFAFAQLSMQEATVTQVDFSCPAGEITVTYDLVTCGSVDSVILSYSPDKCTWMRAAKDENVNPGTDLTITWDADAAGVSYGKFYFKVEYPHPPLPPEPTPVLINGVLWSPVNLDVGGWFCANPEDYGAIYQWGRHTDCHESPTSNTTSTLSNTDDPGHGDFITTAEQSINDWRDPQNDNLWSVTAGSKTINDPCPFGWRVPTFDELNSLGDLYDQNNVIKQPTTKNGIKGYLLENNPDDGNSLFLPAAGIHGFFAGSFYASEEMGCYWSSTPNSPFAYYLSCEPDYSTFSVSQSHRANGFSVRCVRDCIMINGVCWAKTNLDVGGEFCEHPWDYGALYQWGRVADGHEDRTSPCWPLTPACENDASGVVVLSPGDQVPCPAAPCGYFIRHDDSPIDWRTPQDDDLWNSDDNNPIKTANDPCPAGWRVPTNNEHIRLRSTIINGSGPLETYSGVAGRWFGDGGVPSLFLPAAGSRTGLSGEVALESSFGRYWNSNTYLTVARNLTFYSNYSDGTSLNRAYGLSVRCVAEY